MLQNKYQGREQSKNWDEETYRETYYGTEEEVDEKIATLTIGAWTQGKGYLWGWTKQQENPAVWTLEVNYRITYGREDKNDYEDDPSDPQTTSNKTYSLSVRNIQKPVEEHPSYRAKWNHYLLSKTGSQKPDFWDTATNTMLNATQRQTYMWVDSISEMPVDANGEPLYWVAGEPTKPGVSVYDEACFVVTEESRFKTSSAAGSHIKKNINEIGDPPHKFGITGGEWKCDEGSVHHDGRRWVATQTWTRAKKWDKDLYGGTGEG